MTAPTFEAFQTGAKTGRLHRASRKSVPGEDEATTPIELGRLNGYSEADIMHFYAKRRGYGLIADSTEYSPLREAYDEYLADWIRSNG